MSVLFGLDLGTTSISAVALRSDGTLAARVCLPNDAAIGNLPAGHAEQSPQRLLALSIQALQGLIAQGAERPQALGVTGQMHGGLLTDDRLHPVTNLITWQDRRSLEPVPPAARPLAASLPPGSTTEAAGSPAQGTAAAGTNPSWLTQLHARLAGVATESTGCRLSPGYLGTTLYCLLQGAAASRPVPPANVRHAMLIADWIVAQLTGSASATDPSNAASTGLFDVQQGNWSEPICQALGIDSSWLPRIAPSGQPQGGLLPTWCESTGLPAGLPVMTAIGDNQAAVLGSVPSGTATVQINVGTGGQINWPVSEFTRLPGMDTRPVPIGRLMLVGAGLAGGDAYAWVNRTVSHWLSTFGLTVSSEEIYARLEELAHLVPAHVDGLNCQPVFRGTRQQPEIRASFGGIGVENFTPGHVALAVLQGIARGLYSFYEQAGAARPGSLTRIIGSGNGMRNNPLLVREIVRQFGCPVELAVHEEEAAYGCALLAGVGAGVWPDLATAGTVIQHRIAATEPRTPIA